ncbi:EpsI family protein [Rhodoferax sp. TBRC 17660]|uniref:EpsI family protein n=1 Tax=Rhodoferax potami TaxID=3068338 RepID=A0ABU3KPQ6_9BURK|nr:exosortase-associated protein EpsI, B-type [Rhodoferax sp. TBRC 17660]MDT7519680.1 EpsI family protein [Rhodoferax sp. TBRC 17660]
MISLKKNIVLLCLMLSSAYLGSTARPTEQIAEMRPQVSLAELIPTTFEGWKAEPSGGGQVVNPQQEKMLNEVYSETLSRSYVNAEGYRIMLSLAYGRNQNDTLQLHRPESCYPAQGFVLQSKRSTELTIAGQQIAAVQLETNLSQRYEPVTYWTVIGDRITTFGFSKKITEMEYAWHGQIPDGMLVRVSSIDRDSSRAFEAQKQFSEQLIQAVKPEHRNRLIGGNLTTTQL